MPLKKSLRQLSLQNCTKQRMAPEVDDAASAQRQEQTTPPTRGRRKHLLSDSSGDDMTASLSSTLEDERLSENCAYSVPPLKLHHSVSNTLSFNEHPLQDTALRRKPLRCGLYDKSSDCVPKFNCTLGSTNMLNKQTSPEEQEEIGNMLSIQRFQLDVVASSTSSRPELGIHELKPRHQQNRGSGGAFSRSPSPSLVRDSWSLPQRSCSHERLPAHNGSSTAAGGRSPKSSTTKCDCTDSALNDFLLGTCTLMALENAELKQKLEEQKPQKITEASDTASKKRFSTLRLRRKSLPAPSTNYEEKQFDCRGQGKRRRDHAASISSNGRARSIQGRLHNCSSIHDHVCHDLFSSTRGHELDWSK